MPQPYHRRAPGAGPVVPVSLPGRTDTDVIRGRRDPDDRRAPDIVPEGTIFRSLESLKSDPPLPNLPTEG